MSLDGVRAALLAGGLGERMGPLTARACKPLVPYAASCRLVDFSVANAVRSGVPELVLMSLHREGDLVRHLMAHWDDRPGTRLHFGPNDELLRSAGPPAPGGSLPERPAERGTADALSTNAEWIFAPGARDLLVQHADHVYLLDYAPMVAAHRASGADCTIGVQRIERRYVKLFGMVDVDDDLRVRRLVEKPPEPTSDLVFTAFCLFRVDALREVLAELVALGDDGWQHDISRDVVPRMIAQGRLVSAFPIPGYWADIGTVDRYHSEQLKLLELPMDPELLPRTLAAAAPRYRSDIDSLVGAEIPAGAVVARSVLHPGARIEPGATVLRSVVLPGATVPDGVTVSDSIVLAGETLAADRRGLAELS
ncbi:sugar phosphate nucleotidyltransferase [Micromonospora sp. WMMD882]|uniref:sugar phosphate nucleotidyltransferase n=1 Tax=Micromonospora sp. WMMD882 TaxID=3015151 RepID=UPI00248C18EB|nr:sugar phosphate nucleotidyltransferase [Micromonospora sp. WMMD882]WBB80395.1 sugar phosphate nucleotidyltransferase [Micromonospora sp. WMMD882]